MIKQYDAAIIGFGKGGKTLAGTLASAGKTVALIEKSDQMYGGTCINVGCIPSKSLVHSADYSRLAGGTFEEEAIRYQESIAEKRRLTAMLRKKNYVKLDSNPAVAVIDGTASFAGPNTLKVTKDGEATEIEAGQIFINTGARPFVPPIPGLLKSKYAYFSETLLDLEKLPKRLVIIGGGYIGMEFASIYTNFGSKVTVIQDGPAFLPREDEEIATAVWESLEKRGVRILLSAQVESVADEESASSVQVTLPKGKESIPAEAILIATSRRPNVEDLNLSAAGVELTERGAVKTNERLQTSLPPYLGHGGCGRRTAIHLHFVGRLPHRQIPGAGERESYC